MFPGSCAVLQSLQCNQSTVGEYTYLPKRWVKLSPSHSYTYCASKCVFTVVYGLLLPGEDVLTTCCMGSFTVLHVNQGVSLAQAREKGQLVFIEGLKECLGVLLQGESSKGTRAVDFLRYLSVALTLIKPTPGLKSMFIQCRSSIESAFWS